MVAGGEGELLWRRYGVSGIVVFDLSRHAAAGDELVVDLLPDLGFESVVESLSKRRAAFSGCDPRRFLDGVVHPAVGGHVMASLRARDVDAVDPGEVARRLKRARFTVAGAADVEHAQVTRGGLDNAAFDPATLAARGAEGLFACGEALDVDGQCGGLNLAWAWKSGLVAGVAAARA